MNKHAANAKNYEEKKFGKQMLKKHLEIFFFLIREKKFWVKKIVKKCCKKILRNNNIDKNL